MVHECIIFLGHPRACPWIYQIIDKSNYIILSDSYDMNNVRILKCEHLWLSQFSFILMKPLVWPYHDHLINVVLQHHSRSSTLSFWGMLSMAYLAVIWWLRGPGNVSTLILWPFPSNVYPRYRWTSRIIKRKGFSQLIFILKYPYRKQS